MRRSRGHKLWERSKTRNEAEAATPWATLFEFLHSVSNSFRGIDMSGWRPLIKGYFCGVAFDRGCGHVFGLLMRVNNARWP
jgi:hypothetical protein